MLYVYDDFENGLNYETLFEALLDVVEEQTGKRPALDLDYLRFEKMARWITGQRFFHKNGELYTVTSCDVENFLITAKAERTGDIFQLKYPGTMEVVGSFEDPLLNEIIQDHIALVQTLYEDASELGEITVKYELAKIYLFKTDPEHWEKAIILCYESATNGCCSAKSAMLAFCLFCMENGLTIDGEILRYAIKTAHEQAEANDSLAQYNLGWYYDYVGNAMEAIHYYELCFSNPYTIAPVKADIAYTIAHYYKDGVKDSYGQYLLYKDLKKAKQYYECAASGNFECEADLAYINRLLGIEPESNMMLHLAKRITGSEKTMLEQYQQVLQDIKSEFGTLWYSLPHNSQVDLVSGCVVYVNLYSLGNAVCEQLDFSASIIPILKACEIVFRKYLAMGYYDYLIDNNIPATSLNTRHPFVRFDKDTRSYVYISKDDIEFTLGSIKWIIEVKNGPYGQKTVNNRFLEYVCKICNCQSVSERYRLEKYFISLSRRMSQFSFDVRNPAAHSDIMPIWQAEICGNEIIKVRRVLKEFMERIDPMYY